MASCQVGIRYLVSDWESAIIQVLSHISRATESERVIGRLMKSVKTLSEPPGSLSLELEKLHLKDKK